VEKQNPTIPPSNTSADSVLQYALDVTEGREVAGPLVRRACQRHIEDLAGGDKRSGLWWDQAAVDRVFGFYRDVLRLAGGQFEGQPFNLHCSQQFIVGSLFGWKNDQGQRRFRTAYIEEGKGNGKSPLAAGIGLYMLTGDKEPRAEIYSAAVDKDQARILFRDAVAMVDQSPALSSRIIKSGGKDGDATKVWNLAYLETGSFFRPISSETQGRGKSGFRPYCILLDEIHEHPTSSMVELTRKNLKGRPNALAIMITNSGIYDPTSVCWTYHDYSAKVLNGQQDDQFFAYVCGLDQDDNWQNPTVWKKSCPLLGVSVPHSYLESEVRESIGMPSRQSLTRRLNFCEWMEAENPFVDPETWRKNGASVDMASLQGRDCYGALDLSEKNDLSALVLLFPLDDGRKAVLSRFWTPKDGLRQREDKDRAPYTQWVREGHLIAVPGRIIDYRFIAHEIAELQKSYNLISVAFDKWAIERFIKACDDESVTINMTEHRQTYIDMSPSIEALEDDLLEGLLLHGNHPVLSACIHNSQVEKDAVGNRKFTKRKATGRIDGAVALAMAAGLAKKALQTPDPIVLWA
jgi:phage terminase large subunit-like protein